MGHCRLVPGTVYGSGPSGNGVKCTTGGNTMNGKDRRAIYHLAGAIDHLADSIRDASSPQVSEDLSEELGAAVDRAQGMAEELTESGIVELGEEEDTDDDTSGDSR